MKEYAYIVAIFFVDSLNQQAQKTHEWRRADDEISMTTGDLDFNHSTRVDSIVRRNRLMPVTFGYSNFKFEDDERAQEYTASPLRCQNSTHGVEFDDLREHTEHERYELKRGVFL